MKRNKLPRQNEIPLENQWETSDEKLLRNMRLSPKQKLEWLWEINQFLFKYSTPKTRRTRQRLRQRL